MTRSARFAIPLLVALVAAAPTAPVRADELGDDDIVVAGLSRSALADKCKVKVLTKSGDDWKTSKVWTVEIDRRLYLLSSKGGWYKRAQAEPDIALRLGDDDYGVRARVVDGAPLQSSVHSALKDKCFSYRIRSFFTALTFRSNKVIKVVPRPRGH